MKNLLNKLDTKKKKIAAIFFVIFMIAFILMLASGGVDYQSGFNQ